MCWSSEVDFLYPSDRILLSDIKAKINMTESYNASNLLPPGSAVYTGGRMDQVTISVAFINLSLAMAIILVRYASVFWYTNKALALVFTVQLTAMVVTNIFDYCTFSVLYCVCYNISVFRNVHLSISCAAYVVLYLFSGFILLLSSMVVFEYGANHFHMKFRIVERHHNADSQGNKKPNRFKSVCQGHVPHSCAMALLVALAAFRGPLLYDLVSLMRKTNDSLLLSGIICDVCYMVLWVILWLCLTIKQEWQFRILDFVPSMQPRYSMPFEEEESVKSSQMGIGNGTTDIEGCLHRRRHLNHVRDTAQRYSDPLPIGLQNNGDVYQHSEISTEDSIYHGEVHDMVTRVEDDPTGHLRASARFRRLTGQRVTFDESVRSRTSEEEARTRSLPRQRTHEPQQVDAHNVDVTADIHPLQAPRGFQDAASDPHRSSLRQIYPCDDSVTFTREYRNSLRSKCDELYTSNDNIDEESREELPKRQSVHDPLPTLMSSFRDKVRESSIAASSFKEREKDMLEKYNFLEQSSLAHHNALNNAATEQGDTSNVITTIPDSTAQPESHNSQPSNLITQDSHRQSKREQHDTDKDSNSLPRRHNVSLSSDEGHQSSFTPSTVDSLDPSPLPPVHESPHIGDRSPGRQYRHMVGSGTTKTIGSGYCMSPTTPTSTRSLRLGVPKIPRPSQPGRPLPLVLNAQLDSRRRDSANFSLTSSQDTSSSNDSEHGTHGLCSQV